MESGLDKILCHCACPLSAPWSLPTSVVCILTVVPLTCTVWMSWLSLRPSNIPCFIFTSKCAAPSTWITLPSSVSLCLQLLRLWISAPWLVFRSQVRTPWVSPDSTLNLALERFGLEFYIQLWNSLRTIYLLNLEVP